MTDIKTQKTRTSTSKNSNNQLINFNSINNNDSLIQELNSSPKSIIEMLKIPDKDNFTRTYNLNRDL